MGSSDSIFGVLIVAVFGFLGLAVPPLYPLMQDLLRRRSSSPADPPKAPVPWEQYTALLDKLDDETERVVDQREQVERLEREVTRCREEVSYWRDEVEYLRSGRSGPRRKRPRE